MTPAAAPTAAPAIPTGPFTTRDQVQAKLLYHLELAFGKSFERRDTLASIHCTPLYLAMIVSAHFKLPHQASDDAVAASATIADLVSRISELLGIANPELF